MKGKPKGIREQKNTLSKTQEVLYQKEFKTADRAYTGSKHKI